MCYLGTVSENGHRAFDNLARHYVHAVLEIFTLTSMGYTYATQQDVTAIWTDMCDIMHVYSYGHCYPWSPMALSVISFILGLTQTIIHVIWYCNRLLTISQVSLAASKWHFDRVTAYIWSIHCVIFIQIGFKMYIIFSLVSINNCYTSACSEAPCIHFYAGYLLKFYTFTIKCGRTLVSPLCNDVMYSGPLYAMSQLT